MHLLYPIITRVGIRSVHHEPQFDELCHFIRHTHNLNGKFKHIFPRIPCIITANWKLLRGWRWLFSEIFSFFSFWAFFFRSRFYWYFHLVFVQYDWMGALAILNQCTNEKPCTFHLVLLRPRAEIAAQINGKKLANIVAARCCCSCCCWWYCGYF